MGTIYLKIWYAYKKFTNFTQVNFPNFGLYFPDSSDIIPNLTIFISQWDLLFFTELMFNYIASFHHR